MNSGVFVRCTLGPCLEISLCLLSDRLELCMTPTSFSTTENAQPSPLVVL